jgi:hypothetical protein
MLAIVLIVAGVLGLLYGGFTYTKHSHDLQLGNLDLSVKSHETVNIPVWIGVGAVAAGMVMFFMRQRAV